MTLLEKLHEEYYTHNDDLVLFRCTKCGYTTMSLGGLHGHVEQHWPYLKWVAQFLPWAGDWGDWMQYTEILRVDETTKIQLNEVNGL